MSSPVNCILLFGGVEKLVNSDCGILDAFILEDGLGPGEIGIFIEVAAVNNHQVDVFANVALGDDFVGGGALCAVLDGFAEFGFAEGFGLFGEDFFEMGKHAAFEGFFAEGAEGGELFFADSEHWRHARCVGRDDGEFTQGSHWFAATIAMS